jgi:glycosyltransferase involved in cell wall biosynthesis
MNTIPTTSKPNLPSYTVVGGSKGSAAERTTDLSIILLNRGGIVDRGEVLESFARLGPDEILSIEASGDVYAIEKLAMRFPRIKFILLKKAANVGEQINIGIDEASSRLVAVFWSDMRLPPSSLSETVLSSIREKSYLCVVPWLFTDRNEIIPVLQVPTFHRKRLKVLPMIPVNEAAPSLYPYDYCGVYRKDAFVLLGGYDYKLRNGYWQKLDVGFRGHLWGESFVCLRPCRAISCGAAEPEVTTPDIWYRIFFL